MNMKGFIANYYRPYVFAMSPLENGVGDLQINVIFIKYLD